MRVYVKGPGIVGPGWRLGIRCSGIGMECKYLLKDKDK